MKNSDLTKLKELYLAQILSHAWIFAGDTQALQNATSFAQWILCATHNSCGECRECKLFAAESHPDFVQLSPLEDKQSISIDDVRKTIEFSHAKPQYGATKVVIIYPAHCLNRQAANALLKTLEEPVSDTIYILVTSHKELLPKTILSRCQVLKIDASIDNIDKEILAAMLNDLTAVWIQKSTTCSDIAEKWIKQWPNEVLYCLEVILTDVIRFKYTKDVSLNYMQKVEKIHGVVAEQSLWKMLDKLRQIQYMHSLQQKPNMQLFLEDMLLV